MRIAVGSRNPSKVAAVQRVVGDIWPEAELVSVTVDSGVGEMPMNDAQCIAGARNRAQAAIEQTGAELAIGLEGGVNISEEGVMLVGWVAVASRDGRTGLAGSGRLPLPSSIAARIVGGEELGPVMDSVLGEKNVKQRGGAVGALTAGRVPRSAKFEMAIYLALAPFLAPELYA